MHTEFLIERMETVRDMSIRDLFAALIMAGQRANPTVDEEWTDAAASAYRGADALMEERDRLVKR